MGYAKNIKEYREKGLVTQVELAQKLGHINLTKSELVDLLTDEENITITLKLK